MILLKLGIQTLNWTGHCTKFKNCVCNLEIFGLIRNIEILERLITFNVYGMRALKSSKCSGMISLVINALSGLF